MAKRKAFAAHRSSSKRERLPGMSDVVHAIPIGPVPVLPGFTPDNASQNENERRRDVDKLPSKLSDGTLFCHMGRGTVMIEAIEPAGQSLRAEVKFGWMEITGRRIDTQSVDSSGGRDSLGRAN